jgi:tRNA(fMet)-specific endonuclease VapC
VFALDTNTVSFLLRGEGRVAERLIEIDPAKVAIPTVVLHELRYGLLRMSPAAAAARRREHLEQFIGCITILPLDERSAAEAAAIRVELERLGTPIGPFDVLIAGTARAHGATLVTHNTREFGRIEGLVVEDWYS